MNDSHVEPQAILYAAYSEQEGQYAHALHSARETIGACERGERMEEGLRRLFDWLETIAARDALLAETKRHWERLGRPTDDALRSVMARIAGLIEQLSRELQRIELAVRARRDRLAAELDTCNRQHRMQRAYLRKS